MASYFPDGAFHDETNAYRRIPPHQSGLFEGEWKIGTPHHFGTNKHHIFWKAQSSRMMSRTVYKENLTPPPEENIISSHFWRFGGISGSQPNELFLYQPNSKGCNLPMNLPNPDRFSMMFSKTHATGKLLSKLDLLQRSNLGSWTNHRENGGTLGKFICIPCASKTYIFGRFLWWIGKFTWFLSLGVVPLIINPIYTLI